MLGNIISANNAFLPSFGASGITIFDRNMSSLPSNITFTRASTATDFNDPNLSFATNVPVRSASGSWLVQGASTNLLLNSATLSTQNVTTTAAIHTLSFFGTGSVTLSGTATGTLNGTGATQRVQLSFTPTAGTLTLTVSGTVTFANLEPNIAFATSWIPTTGTTATRAADVATISNIASVGILASRGTFLARTSFIGVDSTTVQRLVTLHDGTGTNNVVIYKPATAALQGQAGGAFSGTTAVVAGTFYNSALAYNFVNNAFYVGGANLTGSMGTGSLSAAFTTITIGNNSAGTVPAYAYFNSLSYVPNRVSNAELAIRTA